MNPSTRNPQSDIRHGLLVSLSLFLSALAPPLSAKIPEPDAIFFGSVHHNGGTLLVPENAGDFIVIARLDGITIAQAPMAAISSQFVLKVPVDDGQAPRLPGTARRKEKIRVYLRRVLDNYEEEAVESIALEGLPIPEERGALTKLADGLSFTSDFGGMAAGFAPFMAWAEGFGISANSSGSDSDGDGSTNLQEFAAGTDPTSGSDVFRILEVRRANGVSSVRFGPVLLSREYSIWCSDNLSGADWTRIGTIQPIAPVASRWYDHIAPDGTSHLFYRLTVDVR